MKAKLTFGFAILLGAALMPIAATANNTPSAAQDKSADVRTLTGCLSSGEKAGEYKLMTTDGGSWEVQSKSVNLAHHVGHTVTVTGKVWHPDMHGAKEKAKDAADADAAEHGHLTVSDLEMVSNSCKK
jgi:hypothetical protein